MKQCLHIRISGAVQGVGFRPFIYRLATELLLDGTVQNSSTGVSITIQGEADTLNEFMKRIKIEKPINAIISNIDAIQSDLSFMAANSGFSIIDSNSSTNITAQIMPDISVCNDCLKEMYDINNRRYLYPFINCINCGPRFSIIEELPYDRCNTSMKKFLMCEDCRREYEDPGNRRFHAQPIACRRCGPRLSLWDSAGRTIASDQDAINESAGLIVQGKIIAIKGLGGFQLLTDARSDKAISVLRMRKQRDEKPFALMFPDIKSIMDVCYLSEQEEKLLTSIQSPIVLLRRKNISPITLKNKVSPLAAPGNPYLGIMLPYTPLHHLMMRAIGGPVVATSGNLSEEPMCTDEYDALKRLSGIADFYLVHNRPIVRYIDDSVMRVFAGEEIFLRRARGYAPLPILTMQNDDTGKIVLSLGGHLKNTIALKLGNQVYLSQHIGDLSTKEALNGFSNIIGDYKKLYNVNPDYVVCDIHPDYASTRFAKELSPRAIQVQHHIAHVQACRAENNVQGKALGVAWDGTGYGLDGMIWGSEFFLSEEAAITHIAQFRSFPLPGGEASIRDVRKSALGLLYETFGAKAYKDSGISFIDSFRENELSVIDTMLKKNINCPRTSSAGRLFDAVAAITGISLRSTYEGQAAMMLEFAADDQVSETYKYRIRKEQIYIIDWQPMLEGIIEDIHKGITASIISGKFHNTLSTIILFMTQMLGEKQVMLSGGCFQNMLLLQKSINVLIKKNIKVFYHHRVPTNDGGLSFGQAAAYCRPPVDKKQADKAESICV